MKQLQPTNKFKKDYKRCTARGLKTAKLKAIFELLQRDEDLPARCRPHRLSGNWSGYWECHIESDWLLIYRYEGDFIYLERTGTHSDLF